MLKENELPPLLREINDKPKQLYVIGEELDQTARYIAIVGTRRATQYGKQIAYDIATTLAHYGCTIVSGLAFGIDSCAHRGAIDAEGKTVAVLGGGLEFINDRALGEKIKRSGSIVTEYADNVAPRKFTFPERNRIIAGMSEAVIVIEAPERSGALITADFALQYNRDVIAIPANITQTSAKGSNNLIRDGLAFMATDIGDILERLGITNSNIDKINQTLKPILDGDEKTIFELLCENSPLSLDELHEKSKLQIHKINGALTCLEIKKCARVCAGYAFVTR